MKKFINRFIPSRAKEEPFDDSDLDKLFESTFDDLPNFSEDITQTKTRSAQLVEGVSAAATAGVDSLKQQLMQDILKKAAPEEYSVLENELPALNEYAKDTMTELKTKFREPVARLAREVNKNIPARFKSIKEWMDKIDKKYEAGKLGQRTKEEPSVEDRRASEIESVLSRVFEIQSKKDATLRAQDEAKEEVEFRLKVTDQRRNQELLSLIANSTNRSTLFQQKIEQGYYRESLSVQHRLLFTQIDVLSNIRELVAETKTRLPKIQQNTALPDYIKLKTTEKFVDVSRERLFASMYGGFMDNNDYVKGVKRKTKELISSKINTLSSNLSQMVSMMGMGGGMMSKAQMAGTMVGGLGGDWLSGKLGNLFGGKLKKKLDASDMRRKGTLSLRAFRRSPKELAEQIRDSIQTSLNKHEERSFQADVTDRKGGIKGFLERSKLAGQGFLLKGMSSIGDILTPDKPNLNLNENTIQNARDPAIFDNQTHRSITHVIPLYLAKILQQSTRLSNAWDAPDAPLKLYDYDNRTLDDQETIVSRFRKKVRLEGREGKVNNVSRSLLEGAGLNVVGDRGAASINTVSEYLNAAREEMGDGVTDPNVLFGSGISPRLQEMLDKSIELKRISASFKPRNESESETLKTNNARERASDKLSDLISSGIKGPIEDLLKFLEDEAEKNNITHSGESPKIRFDSKELDLIQISLSKFIIDKQRTLSIKTLPEAFGYVAGNRRLLEKTALIIAIINKLSALPKEGKWFNIELTQHLGQISKAIMQQVKINPSYLKSLFEISPDLFDIRRLSFRALANLDFSETQEPEKDSENIFNYSRDEDSLGNFAKTFSSEALNRNIDSVIGGSSGTSTSAFSDIQGRDAKEDADSVRRKVKTTTEPQKKRDLIDKYFKEKINQLSKFSDDTYERTSRQLTKLSKNVTAISDQSKNDMVVGIDLSIKSLTQLLKAKRALYSDFSRLADSDKILAKSDLATSVTSEYRDTEVKAIESSIEGLEKLKDKIRGLVLGDGKTNSEETASQYTLFREAILEAAAGIEAYADSIEKKAEAPVI